MVVPRDGNGLLAAQDARRAGERGRLSVSLSVNNIIYDTDQLAAGVTSYEMIGQRDNERKDNAKCK